MDGCLSELELRSIGCQTDMQADIESGDQMEENFDRSQKRWHYRCRRINSEGIGHVLEEHRIIVTGKVETVRFTEEG